MQKRTYFATLRRVVDGDTADLYIDVGFGITIMQRVRLKSINAPERGEEGYHASKHFLSYLLKDVPLLLYTEKHKGRYGRYIATIWQIEAYANGGDIVTHNNSVNERMVSSGYAKQL